MVDNVIAGKPANCGHIPETDEDKWNNPQDCFCEQCFMTCCRTCFTTLHEGTHKTHINDFTDPEWQTLVESIEGATNDFSPTAPTPVEVVTAPLTDSELQDELARRGQVPVALIPGEIQQQKDDKARFENKPVTSKETRKKASSKKVS